MQNFINTMLLICAATGSLALGVLLAYAACSAAFTALRIHARSFAEPSRAKAQIARIS